MKGGCWEIGLIGYLVATSRTNLVYLLFQFLSLWIIMVACLMLEGEYGLLFKVLLLLHKDVYMGGLMSYFTRTILQVGLKIYSRWFVPLVISSSSRFPCFLHGQWPMLVASLYICSLALFCIIEEILLLSLVLLSYFTLIEIKWFCILFENSLNIWL